MRIKARSIRNLALAWFLLRCVSAGAARAQAVATTQASPGEVFRVTFNEQSPLSPIEAQNKRHHIKIEEIQRYTLSEETFEARLPSGFSSADTYGLFVWVSAGNDGTAPAQWNDVLDRAHLIAIGADNSGNSRGVGVRFGLALDAVYNFTRQYKIDPNRIYVAGVSGGGKVASMLPIIYSEVFKGAIPMAGVAYFRHIPITGKPKNIWPGMFERPPIKTLNIARSDNRFVLVTGSKDFNRDSIKDIYEEGFLKDRFQHVEYVEVPDLPHGPCDAETLEKAIQSLDSGIGSPPTSAPAGKPVPPKPAQKSSGAGNRAPLH